MHLLSLPENRRYLAEVRPPLPFCENEQQGVSSEWQGSVGISLVVGGNPRTLPICCGRGGQPVVNRGKEGGTEGGVTLTLTLTLRDGGRDGGREGQRYSTATVPWSPFELSVIQVPSVPSAAHTLPKFC